MVSDLCKKIAQPHGPSQDTLQAGLACLAEADLRLGARQISVPTQVVVGRADKVANPRGGEQLARTIKNAELVMLESGHAPFITQPEQVVTALDNLISTVNEAY